MQFTFTPAELRQLLEQALSDYRACDSVYDFSPDALINTVERTLEGVTVAQGDMNKRLENSLPLIDEDTIFNQALLGRVTEFTASSNLYTKPDDNISPEAIGLESPF